MDKLSRASLIEALTIVENWTHADISRLLLQFGLEDVAPPSVGSRRDRANTLMRYLQQNPEEVGSSGKPLAFEIVEYVTITKLNSSYGWGEMSLEEQIPKLFNLLKRDGFAATKSGLESVEAKLSAKVDEEQKVTSKPQINEYVAILGNRGGVITRTNMVEDINNLKSLIGKHKRRLQILKEQKAIHGSSVEPKVIIDIEDIEAEVTKLQAELRKLECE